MGIGFRLIDKKICCGIDALEAGYENEARKLSRRNFEIFKEEGIDTIITNSPEAFKMFSRNYLDFLPDWNIEVKNIWELIVEKLRNKPKFIKNKAMEVVTYHDSCHLGRGCGVYDAPREILELLGYEIKEMPDSREESFCCGSCGGLVVVNPELANKIAKERILQAKRIGVKKMIVCSMKNYELLSRNAGDDIDVVELSEILAVGLGLKVRKENKEEYIDGEERVINEAHSNIKIEKELEDEDYYENYDGRDYK
jgi:Fe-S oxidoreductase